MAVSQISPELAEQLRRVPVSIDGPIHHAPCQVVLTSGEIVDRVYIEEATEFNRRWGRHPSRQLLDMNEVAGIASSPTRLAVEFANELYRAGESGMGYTMFLVKLSSGAHLHFVTGNVVDFPNWPPGVSARDVIGVVPHVGRDYFRYRRPGPYEQSAEYRWCLYER